jgi:type I restriction enzyme, S subunit
MVRYRLGDIVEVISEREDNPSNCKYNKFVGLEHYVSGEVEIKNYGNTDLLKSAMKVFNAGDILVARRNVYLKRASVVNFNGITSGDSIVLRAKDVLMKKLLPFVLNTENFWEYAEKFSDGTMSKRLSPKILLEYEFNLPDKNEQEKLAELLWAGNETKEAYKKLLLLTDNLVKSQFREMFDSSDYPETTIGDEFITTSGGTPSSKRREYYEGGTIPWMTSSEVNQGIIYQINSCITEEGLNNSSAKMVPSNSVAIAMYGATAGKVGLLKIATTTNQAVCSILPNKEFNSYYVYYSAKMKEDWMIENTAGAAQPNISQRIIKNMVIKKPPIEIQNQFAAFVQQADKSKYELQQTIVSLENTVKSLLQQYIQ